MAKQTTLWLASLVFALCAGQALAAEPAAIKLGESVKGELISGDKLEPDGSYFDVFAFDGRAGQRLDIEMTSRQVDSVVSIYGGGQEGPIALNDNADRRGRDARVQVVLPADGRYLIVANAAEAGEHGAYRLSLRETKAVVAVRPTARMILPGKIVQGALSVRSGRAGDDSLYDVYRFSGRAGETMHVSLASYEFEPFVSLRQAGQKTDLAFARDRGQRAAELAVTLPATGDYEVWANAATPGQAGRYSLWLSREDMAPAPEVRAIAYGDTIRGELTAGDAKAQDNSLYDVYRFRAARGDEITVTMRSPMMEAYLAVHRQGEDKAIATAADDGYGGRDAELSFVAPSDGVYDVWANTLGAGQRGQYVFSLERIGRRTGEVARNP